MKIIRIKDTIFNQGKPKVCVPLLFNDIYDLHLKSIPSHEFDVLECRIDTFKDIRNKASLLERFKQIRQIFSDKILLVTFRSLKEGGTQSAEDVVYVEIYKDLIKEGFVDGIDIELSRGQKIIDSLTEYAHINNCFVIISMHDFSKTLIKKDMYSLLRSMSLYKGDFLKIAMMPKSKEDVLDLLITTYEMNKELDVPIITMSMGEIGKISRIVGELFGSCMTFGCVDVASAPGQIQVDELNQYLEWIHESM